MSQAETLFPNDQPAAGDGLPAAAVPPVDPGQPVKPRVQPPPLCRVRLKYARLDALRYTSHLEMHLVWERTLRRAGLPLAYSQGFNPRPRLHVASALPLGFLSRCEIADVWLNQEEQEAQNDLDATAARIQAAAPPGLVITGCSIISLSQPALQTQVQSAEYLALPLDPLDEASLSAAVAALLEAAELPRERRGKPYNLRPLIQTLEIRPTSEEQSPGLCMRLEAREGATGRPEEVLLALGLDPAAFRVERIALHLSN